MVSVSTSLGTLSCISRQPTKKLIFPLTGVGLGAMDSLISYATLITTAHLLSELLPERLESDKPNVLFVLFNGESYDFIGSQRLVYDIHKGYFPSRSHATHPIGFDNVDIMIDIGSLDDLQKISVYHAKEFKEVCARRWW